MCSLLCELNPPASMEIHRCESVVLSLSWRFLELAECFWDVSLRLYHGLVLLPQHVLVTCLHGCLSESAWLLLWSQEDLATIGAGY